MKILIYSINSPPELIGIGKYNGEMASWMKDAGHDVRVITGYPYYPFWKIFSNYKSWYWTKEYIEDVTYIRCPMWVPSSPSGIKRLLHLFSFSLFSAPALFSQIFWRPDIIFSVEPTFFSSPATLIFSKLIGAKAILHIQDYEVDAAFNLGIVRGDFAKKIVLACERWVLARFDYISTISLKMMEKAITKGVSPSKLILFRNWVDLSLYNSDVSELEKLNNYRSSLNIPNNSIVALYSGNMGAKQGLEILSELVSLVKTKNITSNAIHFVFCGHGPGREQLMKDCKDISYVHFLDLKPVDEFLILLRMADIHLLPQRADAEDLVMPSKLTGMLASGRPVLACANADTELAQVLDGRGIVVPPENAMLLYNALIMLSEDNGLRNSLGLAGKSYATFNLDKKNVLNAFKQKLQSIANL